jgi:hypothetical protein
MSSKTTSVGVCSNSSRAAVLQRSDAPFREVGEASVTLEQPISGHRAKRLLAAGSRELETVSVDIARHMPDWSPAGVGQGDCVYDPTHAGRFVGGRFGGVALQVRSDLTSQVHDTIQSLHVELIWRPQCRMLVQQCPYLGRDPRVAGASAGSALSVCAVCGTSGKSARKDDDEGQNVEWFTPSHLIRVRAHLRTRLL